MTKHHSQDAPPEGSAKIQHSTRQAKHMENSSSSAQRQKAEKRSASSPREQSSPAAHGGKASDHSGSERRKHLARYDISVGHEMTQAELAAREGGFNLHLSRDGIELFHASRLEKLKLPESKEKKNAVAMQSTTLLSAREAAKEWLQTTSKQQGSTSPREAEKGPSVRPPHHLEKLVDRDPFAVPAAHGKFFEGPEGYPPPHRREHGRMEHGNKAAQHPSSKSIPVRRENAEHSHFSAAGQ